MNLIARLPVTSHYQEAVLLDEDIAEQIAAGEDPDEEREPARPRLTENTAEVRLLRMLIEAIGEQTAVLVAVNSKNGKFKAPARMPQPFTALEKVRETLRDRKKRADHRKLLRMLYPHRPPPS